MLDNSGKITKNYKLMGTESDPVVIAQRLLNLYRQLHIFSQEKKDAYNKMLIEQPIEVKRIIGTLPGGVVVQQYLSDLEKEAGITDESFEQPSVTQSNNTISSEAVSQEQPRVFVQSAASPEMAHEIAKAFKEALVSSDKNRKEDTKELAQTLLALQNKLTQNILDRQSKNTTQSQSELIKTITHTQTQEFSAIISKALKEIRQMSNDALIDAIQKVHSENLDFFKNQIFSTVSPMPMSSHYESKMQEFSDKYNAPDDAISLDEYTETKTPVKETAIDDISEDDYYQELEKHKEEIPVKTEEKYQEEEIDESLLEGFDGTPEDLFENDNEWKVEKEIPTDKETVEEKSSEEEDPAEQQEQIKEDSSEKQEEKIEGTDQQPKEISSQVPQSEDSFGEATTEGDEEYEWEYVEEDEEASDTENGPVSDKETGVSSDATTGVQAAYNIVESVDEEAIGDDEYEWEYVEEGENDSEASVGSSEDDEYEWEYVEDDGSETAPEEYDFDEDPYNSETSAPEQKSSLVNKVSHNVRPQNNDNIILDENFGISSNDDD